MMPAEIQPKCPDCGIQGLEHIVSEPSEEKHGTGNEWFNVAFCDSCGHVYGIFNKYAMDPKPDFSKMNFPGMSGLPKRTED